MTVKEMGPALDALSPAGPFMFVMSKSREEKRGVCVRRPDSRGHVLNTRIASPTPLSRALSRNGRRG